MGIINILDKHTANLIAAGEVVERPASAVKEMLENCADAGAKSVTVEIKDGGTSYVRLSDDGCGMSRDDVPKTILRHATSKIKTGSDLEAIRTLGFRGEALAAIAAVSRVRILTKRAEDISGTLFECHFGEPVSTEDAGCPDGTTIIVEDIFENTPARRKFLKKNQTEATAVYAVCEKFAISRPDIAVKLISDGNIKLQSPGDGKLINAIYSTIGKEFANSVYSVEYELDGVRVYGYIGKPENCRPNRNLQNFFVNGRYIKSRTMMAALEEGFRSFCPVGKFPGCVLFLDIALNLVDVNIHPAKLEIKFSDDRKIFDCIYFAVKNTLTKGISDLFSFNRATSDHIPTEFLKNKPQKEVEEQPVNKYENNTSPVSVISDAPKKEEIKETNNIPDTKPSRRLSETSSLRQDSYVPDITPKKEEIKHSPIHYTESTKYIEKPSYDAKNSQIQRTETDITERIKYTDVQKPLFTEPVEKKVEIKEGAVQEKIVPKEQLVKARYVGEVFNTYIIAEHGGSMYIIDKHAAHERIIYERIKHSADNNESQYLIEPVAVNLTPKEFDAVKDHPDYFTKVGFDFDEFGDNAYLIRSVPCAVELSDVPDMFTFLAGKLADGNTKSAGELFDRALFTAACKAAIKAGNKFTDSDNIKIINEIFDNDAVLYCPHGRPVITEFSKERIEKIFGRL